MVSTWKNPFDSCIDQEVQDNKSNLQKQVLELSNQIEELENQIDAKKLKAREIKSHYHTQKTNVEQYQTQLVQMLGDKASKTSFEEVKQLKENYLTEVKNLSKVVLGSSIHLRLRLFSFSIESQNF